MPPIAYAMMLAAGSGLAHYALALDGSLLAELRARLLASDTPVALATGPALTGSETWVPVMFLTGGMLIVWGGFGLLSTLAWAVWKAVELVWLMLSGLLHSTVCQIVLCTALVFVGQTAATGFLAQQIHTQHIGPAIRQLDLPKVRAPAHGERIRGLRDLIEGRDVF